MIDINAFVSFLQANVSYDIRLAKEVQVNMLDDYELPAVFVGYAAVDSKDPNIPLESTIFNTNGEDLVQSFEIQIVCNMTDFRSIWVNLYNALIGKNLIPTEVYHTGFTYSQGGRMGLSNGRFWWVDIWKIGFPTNKVLE